MLLLSEATFQNGFLGRPTFLVKILAHCVKITFCYGEKTNQFHTRDY